MTGLAATALLSLATVVDVGELALTGLAALVAGVGVTFTFSLGLLGASRYGELRRDGRDAAATGAAVIAFVGFAASTAAVIAGLIVMIAG